MNNFFMICTMLVLALCGPASAHIKMAFPVPFDAANLDTSPLQPSGSDYPCKKSSYKITAMNKIPVNEAVLLDFKGTAIHNGGTCQLAISMDKEPTADSTFKVIQTFEGGCPTAEGTGGLTFNIPKEFPTTKRATLAWTWFNQIGNREMYMNCAPIEVTGGSDNMDYFNSLPDIFKANIGDAEKCTTAENGDPIMPNPGQFLIKSSTVKPLDVSCAASSGTQSSKQQTPTVPNLAAYGPPAKDANQIEYVDGSSGSGSGGAASSAPGGNNGMYTQPAASPAQPSSAPTAGGNNGMYSQPAASSAQPTSTAASIPASSASSAAPPSTFSTHTVPASSAAPPAYPTLSPPLGKGVSGPATGSSAPTGSSASSSGSAGSSGQCTNDGAIVCNGSTEFGLCDHGSFVWQKVAAGTTCSNGAILKRSQPVLMRRHTRGFHKVRIL